jgi:hypothetical protein
MWERAPSRWSIAFAILAGKASSGTPMRCCSGRSRCKNLQVNLRRRAAFGMRSVKLRLRPVLDWGRSGSGGSARFSVFRFILRWPYFMRAPRVCGEPPHRGQAMLNWNRSMARWASMSRFTAIFTGPPSERFQVPRYNQGSSPMPVASAFHMMVIVAPRIFCWTGSRLRSGA